MRDTPPLLQHTGRRILPSQGSGTSQSLDQQASQAHAHLGLKANCRAPLFHEDSGRAATKTELKAHTGSLLHHEDARHAATIPRLDADGRGRNRSFFKTARGLLEEHLRATNWSIGVLTDPSASLPVDSGTSSSSSDTHVPRGEGLQSSAMTETVPPHLCGLQQTAVPALAQHGVVIEHEWRLVVAGTWRQVWNSKKLHSSYSSSRKTENSVPKELLLYNCVYVLDTGSGSKFTAVPRTSRTKVLAVPRNWTTLGWSALEFFRPNRQAS